MVGDFKSILDLVKALPKEKEYIEHLEKLRWNGTVVSPFDETSKVYVCSNNRSKCKNTGKYFNVKVGTIFEDAKITLIKWFMALYIFSSHENGISVESINEGKTTSKRFLIYFIRANHCSTKRRNTILKENYS